MKGNQAVERCRGKIVGTSLDQSVPKKKCDDVYHKIDFMRDAVLDSGTVRFAFVVVCEGGMS